MTMSPSKCVSLLSGSSDPSGSGSSGMNWARSKSCGVSGSDCSSTSSSEKPPSRSSSWPKGPNLVASSDSPSSPSSSESRVSGRRGLCAMALRRTLSGTVPVSAASSTACGSSSAGDGLVVQLETQEFVVQLETQEPCRDTQRDTSAATSRQQNVSLCMSLAEPATQPAGVLCPVYSWRLRTQKPWVHKPEQHSQNTQPARLHKCRKRPRPVVCGDTTTRDRPRRSARSQSRSVRTRPDRPPPLLCWCRGTCLPSAVTRQSTANDNGVQGRTHGGGAAPIGT